MSFLYLDSAYVKRCGSCHETFPIDTFTKHQRSPDGHGSYCRNCRSKKIRDWRLANRERVRAHKRESYSRNKESAAARMKEYRARNLGELQAKCKEKYWRDPNARREAVRLWRRENKSLVRAMCDAWDERNPGAKLESNRRRKIKQKAATPAWADRAAMRAIYNESVRISRETGLKRHVDHIIPINSKLVCGLHCETNLRIISATANMQKHNRLE